MPPPFTFVNSTGPVLDAASSKLVRSYVMERFWRSQNPDEESFCQDHVRGLEHTRAHRLECEKSLLENRQEMQTTAYSFNQFLIASALDPFGSLALNMGYNQKLPKLVHYYVHHFAPSMFALGASERPSPIETVWLPFVVTDKALMQATLCIAAASYRMVSGEDLGTTPDVLRMEAIRLINQRLEDPVEGISDGTIGAVLALANCEKMAGNNEAWEVHTQGLLKMVELRGGMQGLKSNFMLAKLISWADVSASSVSLTRPRFECGLIFEDPPTVSRPTRHFAPGFSRLGIHPAAQKSMARIVLSMQFISTVLEDVHSGHTPDPPTFTEAFYGLQHRLLSFPFPWHTRPSGTPLVLISCFGASIYLGSIQPDFINHVAYCNASRVNLLRVLRERNQSLQDNDALTLWALFMGGMFATKADGRRFFTSQINGHILKYDLSSWQRVREVLIRFFWLENKCAGPCRVLFDEAMGLGIAGSQLAPLVEDNNY